MRRRFRKDPGLKRRRASREPKTILYVFCEGKTEPHYLEWFRREVGNAAVEVITVGEAGVPKTLVRRAVEKQKELHRGSRRKGSSFDDRFEVWGVLDVDEHPGLDEATITARDNGVFLAISNPCFELWGLLHIQDQTAHIERHPLQRLLSQVMPGYHHDRNPYFTPASLQGQFEEAEARAEALLKRRIEYEDPGGNPSTRVHRLCRKIMDGGRHPPAPSSPQAPVPKPTRAALEVLEAEMAAAFAAGEFKTGARLARRFAAMSQHLNEAEE